MATVPRPSADTPAATGAGSYINYEFHSQAWTNLWSFLEGNNIDENNVDYTNSDGIVVMAQAQTISGAKTFTGASRFNATVSVGNAVGLAWRNAADSASYTVMQVTNANVLQMGAVTNLATTLEIHNGGSARVYLDTGGNLGLGTGTFGASAAKVLGLANGTQGGAAADMVQLTSEDLSAGNTILSVRTEGSGVISAGTPGTAEGTIALKVNGTVYYIPYDTAPAS